MNPFKLLGSLGKITQLQGAIRQATEEAARMEHEASVDGGSATARVSGALRLVELRFAPELIAAGDARAVASAAQAAVNTALDLARSRTAEHVRRSIGDDVDLAELEKLAGPLMR